MLAPPALEAGIQEVEQELDLTIPAGLRAFCRLHNGTGHPADFGWTPEPETGLAPQGEGTAWLLSEEAREHGIPPVQHLPYWRIALRSGTPRVSVGSPICLRPSAISHQEM
ncbi:SMI1/KNR4 family protein [Streptomyces coeruleorubidus]|uniref:SMI1/KNR4 family protein n=1 Tax=Streptomyces coeruleorubidus TaxID=116188 RepID=UPI001984F145|nr:hypothetical protein GCM10010244_54610 [Streptomyces bellus]